MSKLHPTTSLNTFQFTIESEIREPAAIVAATTDEALEDIITENSEVYIIALSEAGVDLENASGEVSRSRSICLLKTKI